MATLPCEKFLGLTEYPLYQQPLGKLKTCQNLRVTPDGLLEARGGLEKLKPNGGTATAPISSGFFTGGHEHNAPVGTIMRRSSAGVFSNNLALQAYFPIFADTAVGTRIYFISQSKFSLIRIRIGTAGVGAYTVVWKYLDTSGVAQTLSGPTEDFKSTGERTISFSPPATWGLNSVNNVYGYVIYAETATAVIGTIPTQFTQRMFLDWQGDRQIYLGASDGATGTANGTVKYAGRDAGGTPATTWTAVTSSLTSSSDPRIRFASWRGNLYFLNGIEQKRYNLDSLSDMGFATPTGAITTSKPGGTGLTGLFHYSVTYGYGAAGELGESNGLQTTATVNPANELVRVTLSGLTSVPSAGTVDVIYVYRSVDLSAVTLSSSYGAFPFYRIATVTRDATGAFPSTYDDSVMAIPNAPLKTLSTVSTTPPSRCRHIAVHRSRMFLASNDQYPGRVWWSKNFEPESFNQDEDFADFTRSTGGIVTKIVEFADQIIVHTEDATYGIANVDQDPPNVYIIAAGVGCVAPEAAIIIGGLYIWPGRNGIYAWDGATQFDPDRNRISDEFPLSMRRLSFEAHGGSRAVAWRDVYHLMFITAANTASALGRFEYNISSKTWNRSLHGMSDVNLGPLLSASMLPWHEDAQVRHPIYGKIQASGSNFHVYCGEFKSTDDGSPYSCVASIHFGPANKKVMTPKIFTVYYKDFTPANVTLSLSNGSYIGDQPAVGTLYTDGASDYTFCQVQITTLTAYTADIVATFTATMNSASTTVPYVLSAYFDGNIFDHPMRTN